jgi:hypothetical protein
MAAKKQVDMPQPKKIYFKNLIFDKDNPNQMSQEQEEGLDNMLGKFGFLENIIVSPPDKKGKSMIHHGEHRTKRLMEAGNTWAWGIVKKLSPVEHRLLRQGMNKLHGTHDAEMDASEYQFIQKQGQLEMLAVLIAQPVEQLMVEKDLVIVTKDNDPMGHYKDTFLEGNLKQLYFIFDNKTYEAMMARLDKIIAHMGVDNNTDMFEGLVSAYEKNNIKKD